jgi:hypothetical protein
MMEHIREFYSFSAEVYPLLNEGGKAIRGVSSVKQVDVKSVVKKVREEFETYGVGGTLLKIGSAGLMPDVDPSGDIDFCWVVQGDKKTALADLEAAIKKRGYDTKLNLGLEILSVGFPWDGNTVQVDFIAAGDVSWAKFIYHAPNIKEGESRYKSAHRNWLFCAVLSVMRQNERFDEDGELLEWDGYSLRLQDGLFAVKKSRIGKKGILKNAKKESERLVTRSPKKFVEFVFGPGVDPEQVRTFEGAFDIIKKKNFKLASKRDEILKKYKEFLVRAGLNAPSELKSII